MTAYKPKTRRAQPQPAACQCAQTEPAAPHSEPELPTHAAPSHLGAITQPAGSYLPRARGGFGFVQTS